MKRFALLLIGSLYFLPAKAQEFPKGFSMPIELGQGFNKPSEVSPLYLLTLQAVPQVTIIPGRLKLGAVLGGFYPASHVGALAGPRLTLKLMEGPSVLTASSFNVHLLGEYLWATAPSPLNSRQLIGGGIGVGSSDLVTLAFKLHREVNQPATWFQFSISYNPFKRSITPL
ncbi:hypothetical protein [Spirosoma sp. KNUC1025]|uniref:hypothetical protein n=1 Tax=Spirosoma sp. KNUC1025 TaxID=2894082 RepID=UPI00387095F4|nr:hypothetical protein LN737_17825 [Spirosoma sp. KNUC1025]